jgi:hypothetical protein
MFDGKFAIVSAAFVGATACASSSGPIRPPAKPPAVGAAAITPLTDVKIRSTRIWVKSDCSATIDHDDIVGKPGKKIAWLVEDHGCSPNDDWHIELLFMKEWNHGRNKKVKIDRDDFKSIKIHANTPETGANGHKYKVYLVYTNFWGETSRVELIDPEVDIEM